MKKIILLVFTIFTFLFSCRKVDEFKYKDVAISKQQEYQLSTKSYKDPSLGTIYYKIYRSKNPVIPYRRIRSCYLQHGYGIDASFVNSKKYTFNSFVHAYYSMEAIDKLLNSVCGEVLIGLQETNLTTILEMTQKVEHILNDVVCKPQNDNPNLVYSIPCAYIGHSKGGAVAFNIARRCMNQTSEMGESGCKQLGEIYSATGVIQGAMATFTVYGAYQSKNSEEKETFVNMLGTGINLVMPLYGEYEAGKLNPTWLDLSPGAHMEDGVPLFVINNIALEKKGWLVADFAATGVNYKFHGEDKESLTGCGPKDAFEYNYHVCKLFGDKLGYLHSNKLKKAFEVGLEAAKKNPIFQYKGKTDYLNEISWDNYQTGDGLADYHLSLYACQLGFTVKENPAVKSCKILPNMNHIASAGGNPDALLDLIQQLSE